VGCILKATYHYSNSTWKEAKMNFIHLYSADNEWIGQFPSVEAIETYLGEKGADINDYKLVIGASKYPPA
jgi:hypothetical protein